MGPLTLCGQLAGFRICLTPLFNSCFYKYSKKDFFFLFLSSSLHCLVLAKGQRFVCTRVFVLVCSRGFLFVCARTVDALCSSVCTRGLWGAASVVLKRHEAAGGRTEEAPHPPPTRMSSLTSRPPPSTHPQ